MTARASSHEAHRLARRIQHVLQADGVILAYCTSAYSMTFCRK